ncbi:hypothetical protein SCARR_01171 [Pontiella sulfatireligans]|uniref:Acetyl xylan esterase domain-containing protein n=2 Tax=Pontiella sulfatireligans TaxID=2750658 RepID=A0A6C2UG24_9BACT|nr:hypothetical protein SCARR_01171 [Pontiella sulfatireligans]
MNYLQIGLVGLMAWPSIMNAELDPHAVYTPLTCEGRAVDTRRGDEMVREYMHGQIESIEKETFAGMDELADWEKARPEIRRQVLDSLGLDPLPEKTDLNVRVVSRIDHGDFIVEKILFESMPKLYVTANFYLPKSVEKPLPTILYLCGHAGSYRDGVTHGAKTRYHYHGVWYARNGYACLIIDTLDEGEISGIHRGTSKAQRFWWHNRGYTPAGVETWNGIRALDYLETRNEVDAARIGVTGRSGGGIDSVWLAAVDERIAAAVPIAGKTSDIRMLIEENTMDLSCDCAHAINMYQHDTAKTMALIAPRPVLLGGSDKDDYYPLDGIVRVYQKTLEIYKLYDAEDSLSLNIVPGGHKSTQEMRIPTFHWFNKYLKNDNSLITIAAEKVFDIEELSLFGDIPESEKTDWMINPGPQRSDKPPYKMTGRVPGDQINTQIDELFVPRYVPLSPDATASEIQGRYDRNMELLKQKTFRSWPNDPSDLNVKEGLSVVRDGVRFSSYRFTSQENIDLTMYLIRAADAKTMDHVVLDVVDEQGWDGFLAKMKPRFPGVLAEERDPVADDVAGFADLMNQVRGGHRAVAVFAPRGVGPTAWNPYQHHLIGFLARENGNNPYEWEVDLKYTRRIYRQFVELGQTVDGMRVWDVRRAIQVLKEVGTQATTVDLRARGTSAGVALYASLFEDGIEALHLCDLPATHRQGPYFLAVNRYMGMPDAVVMAALKARVYLNGGTRGEWADALKRAEKLGRGSVIELTSKGVED